MKEPVALWHAEHRDFTRLLDLLQREVAVFRSGNRPDYDLMREIVEYLTHFPDRLHHPRENVAFHCLLKHDPGLAILVARLEQEHRIIANAGQALLRCLDAVEEGAVAPRAELETAAATYLVYYSMHLGKEEEDVLPLAEKLLTPEEWAKVAAAAPNDHDPLFGTQSGERFRELRRQISRESASPSPA